MTIITYVGLVWKTSILKKKQTESIPRPDKLFGCIDLLVGPIEHGINGRAKPRCGFDLETTRNIFYLLPK